MLFSAHPLGLRPLCGIPQSKVQRPKPRVSSQQSRSTFHVSRITYHASRFTLLRARSGFLHPRPDEQAHGRHPSLRLALAGSLAAWPMALSRQSHHLHPATVHALAAPARETAVLFARWPFLLDHSAGAAW